MSLGVSIIAALVGYIVLMFVSVNITGIIVRGFVQPDPKHQEFTENISSQGSFTITFIFGLVGIACLYALYHFFNIGVVVSALMLMISRIPDLVFEIKTGQKINLKTMPKRPIDIVCNIAGWLALPMLWCSLYYLKSNVTF